MFTGDNLFIDIEGYYLTKEYRDFIKATKPLGIILFKKNIRDYKQLSILIKEIKALKEDIFIAIDEEGGLISPLENIIPPLPQMPAYKYLDYEKAYYITKDHALAINNLGFNLVFAPVLDVNSNYENPVIGARSFSDNEQEVISFSIPYVKALYDANLLITGKHFPGHGLTFKDSHLTLPFVNESKELIYNHIKPFQYFIYSNLLDFIMPAHVVYKNLDPDNMATTSKIILTDILKKKLNFKGLVISDSISMKGFYSDNEEIFKYNIIKAFNSGVDIILSCGNLALHKKVYNIIKSLEIEYDFSLINEYKNLIKRDNYYRIIDLILEKEFKNFDISINKEIIIQDLDKFKDIGNLFIKYGYRVSNLTKENIKGKNLIILTQRRGLSDNQINQFEEICKNNYILNIANPYICKQLKFNCFSLYSKDLIFIKRFILKILKKGVFND